jgi:protein required for attachment to host cells
MDIPKGTIVVVADGAILNLFRNAGDGDTPQLVAEPDAAVSSDNMGSGGRHHSSAANPADSLQDEDGFAAGIVAVLNKRVLDGEIDNLIIIAAPRTLGELRRHYHKALVAVLVGELAKDLTGHTVADIEKIIAAA